MQFEVVGLLGKTALTDFIFLRVAAGYQGSFSVMWFTTLPIPYSCVLNPMWRAPKSSVALNFRQRT